MVHIHRLQLTAEVGFHIIGGHGAIHIHPDYNGADDQGGQDDHLHIGQLRHKQPHRYSDGSNRHEQHDDLGQQPQLGQAVAVDVQKHFSAGCNDQKEGCQPQEQAQNPQNTGDSAVFFHNGKAQGDDTQVDYAQGSHFEEATAGVLCQSVLLRQKSGESSRQIGQLAQEISKVDHAHRTQNRAYRQRGKTPGLGFGPIGAGFAVNQAGGAGVEQTKQTATHHDCDQQLRKIKGGQQGNQTVEGGICADEQGNYHQQDGESDANAQQNRNCILTQFSAVAEGIYHTLKGRCQFTQADAKGRKEAVADGPQPVGRKTVLPRHKAQPQIDAHKQKQQQHEFYETVIAAGEAGCYDYA